MGGGHRPRHALLVVAHAVSGRGLLTATALGVEALGRGVPGLDPRIGTGHAVTALGVSGRGLLTATAPAVSVRVPLPVGGSGAVVRDRTLSRIARGQACDCLLLLPACGLWKQDGWPDVGPRRVWRRLSLSLLWPGAAAGIPPVSDWRERSRSFDCYRSRRERARSPARRGEWRGRSRSHALPNRSRSSVRLPASPARLRAVEAGRLARRGPQEGVEAVVSQPPVAWSSGGRPSCFWRGVPLPLSRLFLQELARFFMSLSGSSSLGAPGVLAGVTASAAASGVTRAPLRLLLERPLFCAATVTPAGAGVLPAAPAAVPGVSGDQQRQGLSRSRGRRSRSSGDGTDRRARSAPEEGLLLLTALRVVGGGAVARPQIRLRVTELTLLLPVPGLRLEVRILVALPGILTARLVLGRRGLLQGMSFASLERVVVRLDLRVWRMLTAPLPSQGFTWREVAWAAFSVAYGLFSSVGKFTGPPRLEVLGRFLPPASGRSFIGAPHRGSYRLVDYCLASLWAGVCGLP